MHILIPIFRHPQGVAKQVLLLISLHPFKLAPESPEVLVLSAMTLPSSVGTKSTTKWLAIKWAILFARLWNLRRPEQNKMRVDYQTRRRSFGPKTLILRQLFSVWDKRCIMILIMMMNSLLKGMRSVGQLVPRICATGLRRIWTSWSDIW